MGIDITQFWSQADTERHRKRQEICHMASWSARIASGKLCKGRNNWREMTWNWGRELCMGTWESGLRTTLQNKSSIFWSLDVI